MSLRAYAHIKTQTRADLDRGGLDNTPVSASGRDLLRAHLGREVLHGSVGRDLFKSYMRNADGTKLPRMYRFDTEALGRCEYVMLTNEQYAVVLVVDVDQIGTAGGDPADLNPYVHDVVRSLIAHNIGPSWGGINPTNGKAQFFSGRDLINVVKTRREEAQAFKALAQDVDAEIADGLDQYDPELIDGVSVLWITQGKAARDETAFRHALKTGHRLRQQGQRLTDAAIIDACEHAYNVAHAHGGDGHDSEMPPMRDRQTMARRVRGYVTQSKSEAYTSSSSTGKATSSERKALATMGRRGCQKAAQRWKTDSEGKYAQAQRSKLEKTHRKKRVEGQTTRARIQALIGDSYVQTGTVLTRKQIMEETGLSRATVTRHLAALREQGMVPAE